MKWAFWETYSAGVPSAALELRVAQQVLREGCSVKEVTLMLVAGSETVRLIHEFISPFAVRPTNSSLFKF